MAEQDTNTVWLTWACSVCKAAVHQSLRTVGFGIDIDVASDSNGLVDAWLETNCPVCNTYFTRSLSPKEN